METAIPESLTTEIDTASRTNRARPKVSFVVPAVNRSGGIRVTVIMANMLREAGYDVRIVARVQPTVGRGALLEIVRDHLLHLWGASNEDWVRNFNGEVDYFNASPNEVQFEEGEIVIAVGTQTVELVEEIYQDVIKMRYCHGFAGGDPDLNMRAWSGPMSTIVVSEGLAPKIQELSGHQVFAIVPNGIDKSEYFEEDNFPRDGIGTVFNLHYNKAPEFTLSVMERLRERFPATPQYIFGNAHRPSELRKANHVWFPSVRKSRELYNRSKVWVVASRVEGFCLPMIEAMSCGCAVVTTDHDGCAGLMEHGKNCFVVPFGDLKAMEEHVAILHEDEELRRRMVEAGRETIGRLNWKVSFQKMEDCLQRIAAARGLAESFAQLKDTFADAGTGRR